MKEPLVIRVSENTTKQKSATRCPNCNNWLLFYRSEFPNYNYTISWYECNRCTFVTEKSRGK